MSEAFSLEDAISGADVPDDATDDVVENATEDTTGEAAPVEKTEPEDSTPEPDSDKDDARVPTAALIAERKKRQELEAELEGYRTKQEPVKTPDVFEDQEGFTSYLKNEVASATWQTRVDLSQAFMRDRHEDYDAKEAKFMEMLGDNPNLAQDPAFRSNPAKFAYDYATKAEKFEAMQDVDKYEADLRAKVESEIRAQVEAEMTGKAQKDAKKREAIMPTLTNSGSAGAEDEGEVSLSDITRLG